MKTLFKYSSWFALVLGLAACDTNSVEVSFAQPFPTGHAMVVGFAPRDQGQYVATDDTACTLLVSSHRLITRRFETLKLAAAQLDSLGLPHRLGRNQARTGYWYQVKPLAADSFQLRWQSLDTLAELGGRQRAQWSRYRGWYYLNTQTERGAWAVERLAFAGGRLHWQEFNRDSLRIRALLPSTVSLKRQGSRLLFTLSPSPGQATRQVSDYYGLWLTKADFLRRRPK